MPKTTVYWWASHGVVVPSVSPNREKLWSYLDLMALRIVSWLRRPKPGDEGLNLPASPMPKVRRALVMLDELGLGLWDPGNTEESALLVDGRGDIFVRTGYEVLNLNGQSSLLPEQSLALTAPFQEAGGNGPNLVRPRPHLRIVPRKVTGEPHIMHSRITTQTVGALAERGFAANQIASMYDVSEEAVLEGIDLERQLAGTRNRGVTEPRLRLALDQNFPTPLIYAVRDYLPSDPELTHISEIDPRLSDLSDRGLFIALSQLGYDGLVTNNYKMLKVPEELAAIVKTKAVVVAVEALGHDPIRAVGALLLELPNLADRVRPDTANIFRLNYARRRPEDGWTYFSKAAKRLERTPGDLWYEVKVTDDEMSRRLLD
ncbi:MAG: hypothetical protein WKF73_01280 [Nocardioidaceae bacterium]